MEFIMTALEHLKNNSRKLEADMIAFNAQISKFAEDIDDAATDLARAERENGDDHEATAPYRAKLRNLKPARG
jgi:chromosome segregation ATPase